MYFICHTQKQGRKSESLKQNFSGTGGPILDTSLKSEAPGSQAGIVNKFQSERHRNAPSDFFNLEDWTNFPDLLWFWEKQLSKSLGQLLMISWGEMQRQYVLTACWGLSSWESEGARGVVGDESRHLLPFSECYMSGKKEIQEKPDLVKLFWESHTIHCTLLQLRGSVCMCVHGDGIVLLK